ncbi:MAG TPA: tRNA pseudouridine(55) synthase TruB [Caldimonas sp.]|nr:tRNA pseudouridine(55) synthase TruB [Caldimonas sp.]
MNAGARSVPPAPNPRVQRRALHGVLLLDKPLGLTSNAALQRARRLLRAEKAGHTGTLDPLATGLLPICFGAATKFSQASLDADKGYRAVLRLGVTTTSGDGEGEVVSRRPVAVSADDLRHACAGLVGATQQRPPMHSALKHAGRPLYAYARSGVEVERASRSITVHALDVVEGGGDTWTVDVRCSKGTYVRTLAEAIGDALGCGAHLAALRRTAAGPLDLREAHTFESLERLDEPARECLLRSPDALLVDWPAVQLDEADAARFLTGLRRRLELPDAAAVRVYGPDRAFLGSASVRAGELVPMRLLSPAEVRAFAAPSDPAGRSPSVAMP